jgi:LysM repeat protein
MQREQPQPLRRRPAWLAAVEVGRDGPARTTAEGREGLRQLAFVIQIGKLDPIKFPDQIVAVHQIGHTDILARPASGGAGPCRHRFNIVLPGPVLSCAAMGSVRRTSWRQYIPYLILNVIVSALTMLVVLLIWGRVQSAPEVPPTATLDALSFAASVVPTRTSTPKPTVTPVTYTVQPGDTMGDIALELGVSIDALMRANNLTNPDTLSAGQVLLVPVTPGAQSAQPGQATSPADTPTPEAGQGASQVEIRGVSGAGDLDTESIRLLNSGGTADMFNWTLDDGQGHTYTFPEFTLHDGAVSVHTRLGTDTVIDLYWGLSEAVWLPGKVITLKDQTGKVISTFSIPNN